MPEWRFLLIIQRDCGRRGIYGDNQLAEREGFEPPIRLPVCRISSAVHSTTLPPLQPFDITVTFAGHLATRWPFAPLLQPNSLKPRLFTAARNASSTDGGPFHRPRHQHRSFDARQFVALFVMLSTSKSVSRTDRAVCSARWTLPAVQIPPVGGLSCCGRRPLHVGNSRGRQSHQQYRGCAGFDAAARFIAYAQSRRVGDGRSPRAERYGSGGGMGFTRRPRVVADALARRWLAGFFRRPGCRRGRSNPALIEWNECRGFNEAVRDTCCSARLTGRGC
jgi:hypothetical protein